MTPRPPMPHARFVLPACLAAAVLGALVCLWGAWCEFPSWAWNDLRLAPAFALRHGVNPYPLLGDGPLFTWIYGPVGLFVNLPATFAPSAQAAVQAACAINLLTVLSPLAIIFFGTPELRARGPAVPALALALAVLLTPRTTLLFQTADNTAVALGLLSCWWLARVAQPRGPRLAGAAALCALAIWAKQIAVFLPLAQLAYLWIASGRATALRYAGWVALFGLTALGAFAALFGFANLRLNLIEIPGRLPWAEPGPRLALRIWPLVQQVVLPALLLAAIAWRRRWPARTDTPGRLFQVSALAAGAMLPIGLAGFFKAGGDTNLLHALPYLLPAGLLLWLARDTAPAAGAALRLAGGLAAALALKAAELDPPPARPLTQHFAAAAELAAARPRALWFPQNPVLGLYLGGRLWHSEDGVYTRYLAGHRIREPDFRRHLPPELAGIVYPGIVADPFALALLPEFSRTVRVSYWNLHVRPAPPAP